MRDLKRNQVKISYKNLVDKKEITDEYGNATGSYERIYSDVKELYISVSANRGDVEVQGFGAQLDYDRTLITSDMGCEINENSIIYIGGETYTVKARAVSLNQIQIAIKREEINENDTNSTV